MWHDGACAKPSRVQEGQVADTEKPVNDDGPEPEKPEAMAPEAEPAGDTPEAMAPEAEPADETPEAMAPDADLEPGTPTPARKRRRRKRASTAVEVSAALDAMDDPGAATVDREREAEALEAEDAAEREALAATVEPMPAATPVGAVTVEPRRGLAARLLILVVAVIIVLALGAALGFGAATLVPGLADASPPAATLAPATERPTAPPLPTARPSPTTTPSPSPEPSATPLVHTVKRNENLTKIAARYDVTVAAIVEANGLKNANVIEIGQKLVIPTPTPEP